MKTPERPLSRRSSTDPIARLPPAKSRCKVGDYDAVELGAEDGFEVPEDTIEVAPCRGKVSEEYSELVLPVEEDTEEEERLVIDENTRLEDIRPGDVLPQVELGPTDALDMGRILYRHSDGTLYREVSDLRCKPEALQAADFKELTKKVKANPAIWMKSISRALERTITYRSHLRKLDSCIQTNAIRLKSLQMDKDELESRVQLLESDLAFATQSDYTEEHEKLKRDFEEFRQEKFEADKKHNLVNGRYDEVSNSCRSLRTSYNDLKKAGDEDRERLETIEDTLRVQYDRVAARDTKTQQQKTYIHSLQADLDAKTSQVELLQQQLAPLTAEVPRQTIEFRGVSNGHRRRSVSPVLTERSRQTQQTAMYDRRAGTPGMDAANKYNGRRAGSQAQHRGVPTPSRTRRLDPALDSNCQLNHYDRHPDATYELQQGGERRQGSLRFTHMSQFEVPIYDGEDKEKYTEWKAKMR